MEPLALRALARLTGFILVLTAFAGCANDGNDLDMHVDRPQPIDEGLYQGPPVQLRIEPAQDDEVVTASVRTPTGGWRFALDEVVSIDDRVELYATLVRPGPEEIVTQALETMLVQHRSDESLDEAVLFIRTRQRGVA